MKTEKQYTPKIHFSPFKGMWYAIDMNGNEQWNYTQAEAELFAGITTTNP